ncbi:MAG TPA: tetratricopeptide repeat protein [Thermoanaerobaculia bacterium]|nr:tetratricopeptide repeat protein [Thermoanaerobaculia bacterium]
MRNLRVRKLPMKIRLLVLPVLAVAAVAALATAAVPPPNVDRAVAAQRALAERQPTAEVWNDLGNLLELAGHDAEAREAYEKALALDPKLVSAHYNLGLLLRQAGEERDAMKHFRDVVELAPDDAWGWFQVGSLDEARGAEKAAVDAYARAFALDPRLSFGDVNPQVIDSKLTTESLLRAQEERPAGADAARAYEDPRHIAKLLLPQPPPPGSAPAATPTPEVATAPPAPAKAARPGVPAADPRTLGPQDIRAGSKVGGVTQPGQGRNPQPPPNPAYSDLLRQQLELQQEQQRQMEEDGGADAPVEAAPEGIYVPGVRSSGQLGQAIQDWRPGR